VEFSSLLLSLAQLAICRNQCEYFRVNGQAHRLKHLHDLLEAAKVEGNEEAENRIRNIILRVHAKAKWRRTKPACPWPS
jgi:hypothetical protein